MPITSKEIITLPVTKAFLMTDDNNHPFVISFHVDTDNSNSHVLYFNVTKNSYYSLTKVPIFSGTCYSENTITKMLVAFGCSYVKRIPVERLSIISQDFFEGIVDGIAIINCNSEITNPDTVANSDNNSAESLEHFFEDFEEGISIVELPFQS